MDLYGAANACPQIKPHTKLIQLDTHRLQWYAVVDTRPESEGLTAISPEVAMAMLTQWVCFLIRTSPPCYSITAPVLFWFAHLPLIVYGYVARLNRTNSVLLPQVAHYGSVEWTRYRGAASLILTWVL
jgi:hypothetical protein